VLTLNSTIQPSRICLGTAEFGSRIDRRASWAVMDAYAEAGGNFFDTAHIYAAWLPNGWGASERTLGEWIRENGLRDKLVLATKGGHPPLDKMTMGRCGPEMIESDLSESLDRLGVEYVDIYWLHRDDRERTVSEIVDTLSDHILQSRIKAWGVSNWTVARICAALADARKRSRVPPIASQLGYSLADRPTDEASPSPMRYMDSETHAWHTQTRFPSVAYSSQATGYFGIANCAWARKGFPGDAPAGRSYDGTENRARLLQTIKVADERGVTANQVALACLLHQPFPVYPIIGTHQVRHVREAMQATMISLTAEEMHRLNANPAQ